MDDKEKIHWNEMTQEQRSATAVSLAKIDMMKIIVAILFSISVVAQPLWQAYFKDQDAARSSEILKSEKQSESALALSKAAIAQVTILSSQLGELKAENISLRVELQGLTEKYTELMRKYKDMEAAYAQALEEKQRLELRIDELFKNHPIPPK